MNIEDKLQEIINRFDTSVGTTVSVKGKLLSTTNRRFQKYVMLDELDIEFEKQVMIFPTSYFHTSYITKVEYKLGNQFHLTTRNSVYVVELLDVEYLSFFEEGVLFEMSSDEIELVEKYLLGEV